jgi:Uma2 family endonuclease
MTVASGAVDILGHVRLHHSHGAEHHMGMPAEATRRWTAREVRALIAAQPLATPRYELVDGELLVTPSPALPHQFAVKLLLVALDQYLRRHAIGECLSSPSDVELEPEDVRQPDVLVVPRDELQRAFREGNPIRKLLLAIEVVSPSSGRHDRLTKRPGYQRHVAEYWIVDTDARLIERWQPGDARPEILSRSITWKPSEAGEAFELALPEFFAEAHGELL